ncbi:MAG: terpene cyclase/mutase family protein [Planctomycetes bacterium]|nr:terpene cyclase/mutase family protein [Planctomycetota bacterium]
MSDTILPPGPEEAFDPAAAEFSESIARRRARRVTPGAGPLRRLITRAQAAWNDLWQDRQRRHALLGMTASLLTHVLLLAILGTIVLHTTGHTFEFVTIETGDGVDLDRNPIEGPIEQVSLFKGESGGTAEGDNSNLKALDPLPSVAPTEPIQVQDRPQTVASDLLKQPAPVLQFKNDYVGRGLGAKGKSFGAQGGNEASERAVKLGLKWLAEHQAKNGSWSFQHGPDSPGQLDCPTGATGLALLTFLGAGHTHKPGKGPNEYRKTVNRGISYLLEQAKRGKDGADLRGKVVSNEGMYVQGICTLALCEALAMSKDGSLRGTAQQAVDFIVHAQEKSGGGWRYNPGDPGDTTVTGWQVMALKSAKAAGLKVPDETIQKVQKFLDSVSVAGGSQYAYTPGGPAGTPAITAIGLLCRMYLGWTPDLPALDKGVGYLSEIGPVPNNVYYNYYATQVLHHWGGERWQAWNQKQRDRLVATQIQEGPSAGSWSPAGDHAGAGGRLYETCLSVMTLEVYYRYLPMYGR